MKLYSNSIDPFSHRCRIVLFEKGMDFEVIDVDLNNKPEDLSILSPYSDYPVLEERDLVLTDPNIINEYIKNDYIRFRFNTMTSSVKNYFIIFLILFLNSTLSYGEEQLSDDDLLIEGDSIENTLQEVVNFVIENIFCY